MSKSAKTLVVWAIYILGAGITLFAFPNALLRVSRLSPTEEPWIRIMGVLAICLGYIYLRAGLGDVRACFEWTIHTRVALLCLFIALVFAGLAPWQLILFGIVDFLGAVWTWWTMRGEAER